MSNISVAQDENSDRRNSKTLHFKHFILNKNNFSQFFVFFGKKFFLFFLSFLMFSFKKSQEKEILYINSNKIIKKEKLNKYVNDFTLKIKKNL